MKMYCLGYLNIKGESFGSQSSLATSGSNTSGSQTSKDIGLNSDNKVLTISMIDLGLFIFEKSLLEVFGRIKLHKKVSRNITFLIKKFISIKRSILYYCVSNDTFYGMLNIPLY